MRWGRRALATATLFVAACGYPSFDFLPAESDSAPLDATTDTFETIDARDSATDVSDTRALDTLVGDTTKSDADALVDTGTLLDTLDTAPPTDTTTPPDTTPPPFDALARGCTGTHRFCDDWDTSTTADAHWMSNYIVSGAYAIDTTDPYSPSQDFLSTISATSGSEASAVVDETLTSPALDSYALVDVEVFIDGGYGPGSLLVKMQRPGTGRGFDLSVGPTDLYVEVLGITTDTMHLGTPLPLGRWFHVRMKGQLMTSGAHLTVWVEDMTVPVYDKSGLSTATIDSTTQELSLGVYTDAPPISAYHARFDDCSLDFL
jgi:hypothetical protein